MKTTIREISYIILSGDYPKLNQKEIGETNRWLEKKFGAHFKCQNNEEASRLIKSISAWTRHYQHDLQKYIDSEVWQGQKIDALDFQKEILANELKRAPLRRKTHTVINMLKDMLKIFCPLQQGFKESTFEKHKLRNFIASSKLEGINLEGN